ARITNVKKQLQTWSWSHDLWKPAFLTVFVLTIIVSAGTSYALFRANHSYHLSALLLCSIALLVALVASTDKRIHDPARSILFLIWRSGGATVATVVFSNTFSFGLNYHYGGGDCIGYAKLDLAAALRRSYREKGRLPALWHRAGAWTLTIYLWLWRVAAPSIWYPIHRGQLSLSCYTQRGNHSASNLAGVYHALYSATSFSSSSPV